MRTSQNIERRHWPEKQSECRREWSAPVTLIAQGTCCARHLARMRRKDQTIKKSLPENKPQNPGGQPNVNLELGQSENSIP
jgi:hypothetical protein